MLTSHPALNLEFLQSRHIFTARQHSLLC